MYVWSAEAARAVDKTAISIIQFSYLFFYLKDLEMSNLYYFLYQELQIKNHQLNINMD